MSQDQKSDATHAAGSAMNIVLGGAGVGLLLAAAGFAFVKSKKGVDGNSVKQALSIPQPRIPLTGSKRSKWALNGLIRAIEHDSSRKVLLTVLKAIAKRAG